MASKNAGNVITFEGKITEASMTELGERIQVHQTKLAKRRHRGAALLAITSNGGSPFAAENLARQFCYESFAPLHTIAVGEVSSAAILLWLGGKRRLILPSTILRFHGARKGLKAGHYSAMELSELAEDLTCDDTVIAHTIFQRCRPGKRVMSTREILKMLQSNQQLSPEVALHAGLADKIVERLPK